MEFVYTDTFQKEADRLLNEEELQDIEGSLIGSPTRGDVIPGSGGLRKFRMKYRGRGTRGGLRVIHYFLRDDTIILVVVYSKSEKGGLTRKELSQVAAERDEVIHDRSKTRRGKRK